MFCPKCRTEYIERIEKCPECNIKLVLVLPAVPALDCVDFQEVLTTFSPVDIAMIKLILEGIHIDFYFLGEFFNYVDPMVQPSKLMVRRNQIAEVGEVLKDMRIRNMIPFKDQ